MFHNILLVFGKLDEEKIPSDSIVLTSFPSDRENVLDIHAFVFKREKYVDEFEEEWQKLSSKLEQDGFEYHILQSARAAFFGVVINILGQWCEAIDDCIKNYDIQYVQFDRYSAARQIFVYEAEGEVNRELLYKKWFYLPFYIEQYLKSKYPHIPICKNKCSGKWLPTLFFYVRNVSFLCYKLFWFLIYKFTTRKRNFGRPESIIYLLSSRGIIQSQFLKNFALAHKKNTLVIVNEQTNKPRANKKHIAEMNHLSYYYAEGNLPLHIVLKLFFDTFLRFLCNTNQELNISFNGINIRYSSFIKELFVRDFDYKLYSYSLKRSVKGLLPKVVVSFDMKTPHAYYLKQELQFMRVVQIQAASLESWKEIDFVFTDFFYFTDPVRYRDFRKYNFFQSTKVGCCSIFKYYGESRKSNYRSYLKRIAYFTQPVEFDEQGKLISIINDFTKEQGIEFYIKPHPRENYVKPDYIDAIVIGRNVDYVELIKESDVVITRNSSIGLDCWVYGVPCIFVRVTQMMHTEFSYIPNDYMGNVKSYEELMCVLKNYNLLVNEFKNHELFFSLSPEKDLENVFEI